MSKVILRNATVDDLIHLSDIRVAYLQQLYHGYLAAGKIKELNHDTVGFNQRMLQEQDEQIIVAEQEGKIVGYIVCLIHAEDPRNARMTDAAILPGCDTSVRYHLFEEGITRLCSRGVESIRMWIVKDNFRVRFLLEQFGFRSEQVSRIRTSLDLELPEISYIYRTSKPDSEK